MMPSETCADFPYLPLKLNEWIINNTYCVLCEVQDHGIERFNVIHVRNYNSFYITISVVLIMHSFTY